MGVIRREKYLNKKHIIVYSICLFNILLAKGHKLYRTIHYTFSKYLLLIVIDNYSNGHFWCRTCTIFLRII